MYSGTKTSFSIGTVSYRYNTVRTVVHSAQYSRDGRSILIGLLTIPIHIKYNSKVRPSISILGILDLWMQC